MSDGRGSSIEVACATSRVRAYLVENGGEEKGGFCCGLYLEAESSDVIKQEASIIINYT